MPVKQVTFIEQHRAWVTSRHLGAQRLQQQCTTDGGAVVPRAIDSVLWPLFPQASTLMATWVGKYTHFPQASTLMAPWMGRFR